MRNNHNNNKQKSQSVSSSYKLTPISPFNVPLHAETIFFLTSYTTSEPSFDLLTSALLPRFTILRMVSITSLSFKKSSPFSLIIANSNFHFKYQCQANRKYILSSARFGALFPFSLCERPCIYYLFSFPTHVIPDHNLLLSFLETTERSLS